MSDTGEVWRALLRLSPSIVAFLLSYAVIFISWVNHRAALKLVVGSSAPFLYANGFLLLTVVSIPFPTGMLSELVATDHAAPAVVVYNAVLGLQALGWVALSSAALRDGLVPDDDAAETLRVNRRHGYEAYALYSLLAIAGLWFPRTSVTLTALSWLFWLWLGLRMKHA